LTLPPKTNRAVKLKVIFCVQAVISPLLANLYLHGFDKGFHGSRGPARWAGAKLVRYADDFVVLARFLTPNLRGYIEEKLETWMGLEINREKTRVVDLKEKKASLDFLGYAFRYDRDLKGRGHFYLNVVPSKKALQRERDQLRAMTDCSQSHKPLPRLIAELNRHLQGWANYFSFGRPRAAYGKINTYVLQRLCGHVGRRSQRPYRPPQDVPFTQQFLKMGLRLLARPC
jgi:RNA-directed DNA polymerase